MSTSDSFSTPRSIDLPQLLWPFRRASELNEFSDLATSKWGNVWVRVKPEVLQNFAEYSLLHKPGTEAAVESALQLGKLPLREAIHYGAGEFKKYPITASPNEMTITESKIFYELANLQSDIQEGKNTSKREQNLSTLMAKDICGKNTAAETVRELSKLTMQAKTEIEGSGRG